LVRWIPVPTVRRLLGVKQPIVQGRTKSRILACLAHLSSDGTEFSAGL